MSQPINWDSAEVTHKTIYPSTDCFHMRLVGDTYCLQCGKPWAEIKSKSDRTAELSGDKEAINVK